MIEVLYRNHRGETALRHISPLQVYFGSTEYHPKRQWLMLCYDFDKKANRTYALAECDFTKGRHMTNVVNPLP